MTEINRQKEETRLRKLYEGMTDPELDRIAADFASLTDAARAALRSVLLSRGLPARAEPLTAGDEAERKAALDRERRLTEPVLVRRYRDLSEATIAQSVLDSAGIESFLVDDNVIRLYWLYSDLLGGVKLMARRRDAEDARSLLAQDRPDRFEVEGIGPYEQPRCPKCGSMEISLDGLHRPASYASLLVKFPIPIVDDGWRCHSCGHGWEEEDRPG